MKAMKNLFTTDIMAYTASILHLLCTPVLCSHCGILRCWKQWKTCIQQASSPIQAQYFIYSPVLCSHCGVLRCWKQWKTYTTEWTDIMAYAGSILHLLCIPVLCSHCGILRCWKQWKTYTPDILAQYYIYYVQLTTAHSLPYRITYHMVYI